MQSQYQDRFGCGGVDLQNATNMYAQWTTTVICNVMVQMSRQPCSLSDDDSRPVCADTCAQYAQSEAFITANKNLCQNPSKDLGDLIRADFTTCGLPDRSLTGKCITGADNEPDNCGFGGNTIGLCTYCAAGGTNSTDTCCYNSKAESRCEGVKLPTITPTVTFLTSSTTSASTTATSTTPAQQTTTSAAAAGGTKLSGGAIAGIVIGAIAGIALIAFLLFFCLRTLRKRKGSQQGSIFNQPAPSRKATPATSQQNQAPQGYEVLPGGRIARMSALEGHSGHSAAQHRSTRSNSMYATSGKKGSDESSSDEYADVPEFEQRGALRPPPMARRHGSLSSASVLGSDGQLSPVTSGGFSSPQGMMSQQSEQLPFFKDYYSSDDIHPSDRVSVLWAYQPRAGDEFALERGEMLKVIGIWDDGWATGIKVDDRAEDYEERARSKRDSGVSSSSHGPDSTTGPRGEMKAFPLVCVCVPQHWRKIIEGDGSTESGTAVAHPPSRP